MLQSRTKLLQKVFPIMSTFLRNKPISKTTPLREENPFPRFNVASHKRPGIRLSFEYITTLLSGEGGEGRTGTATIFRKMLSKYTIFSTVLSKIVAIVVHENMKLGGNTLNNERLSLVNTKFPTKYQPIVALILLPYNLSIILKLRGHIKGRLISRILNF